MNPVERGLAAYLASHPGHKKADLIRAMYPLKLQVFNRALRSGSLPAKWCRAFESVCGGAVTVHDLQPLVFGFPASRAA